MKKQLLGVNITIDKKQDIIQRIHAYLHHEGARKKRIPFVIVTPNPEQVMLAQSNGSFLRVLNAADVAIPDGVGIVWAMKRKSIAITRITGIDFMQELVHLAQKEHKKIALVGGRGTTALDALRVLQTTYTGLIGWSETLPELTVVGDVLTGISDEQIDALARRISTSNTTMVFVGLGAPKQELFIDLLTHALRRYASQPVVCMTVGGSFDMIAGVIPRAPLWVQRGGIEWMYRLLKEPWRWKRQLELLRFFFLVQKQ